MSLTFSELPSPLPLSCSGLIINQSGSCRRDGGCDTHLCLHLLPPLDAGRWDLLRLRGRQASSWGVGECGATPLSWGGYVPSFGGSSRWQLTQGKNHLEPLDCGVGGAVEGNSSHPVPSSTALSSPILNSLSDFYFYLVSLPLSTVVHSRCYDALHRS